MFALSVSQPTASLLALGLVRWNERGWATGYRGPVWLHAAEPLQDRSQALWDKPEVRIAFRERSRVQRLPDAPRGCVIALVDLVDCFAVTDGPPAGVYPTPLDGLVCPQKPCNSILVFDNPRILDRPVYTRGGARLYQPDQCTLQRLEQFAGVQPI